MAGSVHHVHARQRSEVCAKGSLMLAITFAQLDIIRNTTKPSKSVSNDGTRLSSCSLATLKVICFLN